MKHLKFVFAYVILFCITGFSQSIHAAEGGNIQRRLSFAPEATVDMLRDSMRETQARNQLCLKWQRTFSFGLNCLDQILKVPLNQLQWCDRLMAPNASPRAFFNCIAPPKNVEQMDWIKRCPINKACFATKQRQ